MAGRVVCNGVVVSKPGQATGLDASIHLRGERLKYASRGGYKLEHALRVFGIDVREQVVLDAGASTGGFTDCLLQAGARRVYAVDVGYGQLRGALAANDRVRVMERTNIGELGVQSFPEPNRPSGGGFSYLSLLKAIPILAGCFSKPVRQVCLIKPLYEGLARELMNNLDALQSALENFFVQLADTRFRARGVVVSPILGGNAAMEFLLVVDAGEAPCASAAELARHALETCRAKSPRTGARRVRFIRASCRTCPSSRPEPPG